MTVNIPFQLVSFCLAMLIYGVFGSPTPDNFGIVEILIAILLLMSVRVADARNLSFLALGFGLVCPVVIGMITGNLFNDIIRDIIPFIFLFTPLFFGWISKAQPRLIIFSIVMIGIIFSLRTFYAYQNVLFYPSLWGMGSPADLLYLANSPEVLFSCLACVGFGGQMMMEHGQKLKGLSLISLSCLPLIAMALMTQRAGIGAVIIFILIYLGGLFYRRPRMAAYFIISLTVLGYFIWPYIDPVFQILWQKTELVGFNARGQEWSAVMNILSQTPITLFFGIGWGGHFENPAVGGLNVNYTHSLISSLLLKTGVIGSFIILSGCLAHVMRELISFLYKRVKGDYVLLGMVTFPFIISVFLYASYKSLGFGLILLIFSIFSNRKLEKNDQAVS